MASLKRSTALLGLIGIGWIGYTLVVGDVSLVDAGIRGGAILGAVLVLTRLFSVGVRALATSLER